MDFLSTLITLYVLHPIIISLCNQPPSLYPNTVLVDKFSSYVAQECKVFFNKMSNLIGDPIQVSHVIVHVLWSAVAQWRRGAVARASGSQPRQSGFQLCVAVSKLVKVRYFYIVPMHLAEQIRL